MSCGMNEITPAGVRNAWFQQVLRGHQSQHSPLTMAFFSPSNVEWIRDKIERLLRETLKEPNIKYVINQEFAQTMVDVALRNTGWAYDVEGGLPRLNQWVIDHETNIAILGQRIHRLYETRLLQGNRMRVYPYGIGDRTLHVRGENQVTQSPYLLNHPWKSQHQAYLKQVLNIDCPTRTSTCNDFDPHYPTP